MAGPRGGRSRRRSASSGNSTSTASKVFLGALGLFSVLCLFSSHIRITQQGPGTRVTTPAAGQGGMGGEDGGTDDVLYDHDPRHAGGGAGGQQQLLQQSAPAVGPMDYIPLQCDGGVPDVDLSYWKNIPQDK